MTPLEKQREEKKKFEARQKRKPRKKALKKGQKRLFAVDSKDYLVRLQDV